jgi:hypothetical protein
MNSLGEYYLESFYCNGAEEPVLSQKYCEIPMTVLRTERYSLSFDDVVRARIKA